MHPGPAICRWRSVFIAMATCMVAALAVARAPTSEAELHAMCKERGSADGAAFNTCVEEGRAQLTRRRTDCIATMRQWSLPSGAQVSAYRECTTAETIEDFRRDFQRKMGGEGDTQRLPLQLASKQFGRWVGFNGPVKIDIVTLHSAIWTGASQGGEPTGRGRLNLRFDYLLHRPVSGPMRKTGEIVLNGQLLRGLLEGKVELLAHPEILAAAALPLENQFVDGENRGLPVSQACVGGLPAQHPGTTVEWMGSCRGTLPHAGLAVYSHQGRAFDIACFSDGKFADRGEIQGFAACEDYWYLLPRYCHAGPYRGQCEAGVPHGVGVRMWNETAGKYDNNSSIGGAMMAMGQAMSGGIRNHFVQRGQFQSGQLTGYGFSGRIDGCGMAGCSGPALNEAGWFGKDRLTLQCASYTECVSRISGGAYTAQVADDTGSQAKLTQLRQAESFVSALEAFQLTKGPEDLRRARGLAKSREEQSLVEHALFRVSGYDKIVAVQATLSADANSNVNLQETEKVLGFIRNTRAELPLNMKWRLSAQNAPVPLRYGRYKVSVVLGIKATTEVRTCTLGVCRDDKREEYLQRKVQAVLDARNLTASGDFDLKKTSAAAGSFLGMLSSERLADVEPFVRVEEMELLP